jgi:hypothetical protein
MNEMEITERHDVNSYIDSVEHYSLDKSSVLNEDNNNGEQSDCEYDDEEFKPSINGRTASTSVHRKIAECLTRRSGLLDLSRQGLQTLPEEVLRLEHIEVGVRLS